VHCVLDGTYPALLRDIRERPPILFTRGRLTEDTRAIAVVGSRNASDRGLGIAGTIAAELARQGITVVSGLARGVDAAAHRAALEAGGRTVAVIGTGISRCYPSEHRHLQQEIAERGLVVSQFWPDAPPRREHFPMRNAVMSGYSAATVVVEAGEHSGVRVQTRLALEHGRQVVLLADLLHLEWARALADRPTVTVAADPDELFSAVHTILEQRAHQLAPVDDFADLVLS
jgi:DNA processing protein